MRENIEITLIIIGFILMIASVFAGVFYGAGLWGALFIPGALIANCGILSLEFGKLPGHPTNKGDK